jgi:hypothetical protein
MKKIKEKYGEQVSHKPAFTPLMVQDEDERELALKLLGSRGDGLSKEEKRKNRKHQGQVGSSTQLQRF